MAADLELRPTTREDVPEILRLMATSLGEGAIPRTPEFWTWKHEDNPFGPSPGLLAVSGGEIVGLRVFMRWRWRAGAESFEAVRAVDTATHPDWRGKGVFTRLTRELLRRVEAEGVSFVFNTPNQRSLPGYLKMGWRRVGRVSPRIRPYPVRALAALARSDEAGAADGRLGRSVIDLVDDAALPAFIRALEASEDRLSTPKSPGFLRWRYADVPGIRYRAAWSIEGREGAVLVFRTRPVGRWVELRLCEVLVGEGPRSRRRLREILRSAGASAGASFSSAMPSTGAPRRALLGAGFAPAPRLGPVLTVRPLGSKASRPDPARSSAWAATLGDLELF